MSNTKLSVVGQKRTRGTHGGEFSTIMALVAKVLNPTRVTHCKVVFLLPRERHTLFILFVLRLAILSAVQFELHACEIGLTQDLKHKANAQLIDG